MIDPQAVPSLHDLLLGCARAYDDETQGGDAETALLDEDPPAGDSLAVFIIKELLDVSDPAASIEVNHAAMLTAALRARDDLQAVCDYLERAL